MLQKQILGFAVFVGVATAQTFQRLGACPDLGCIFPPHRTDFLAGQAFDIRLEVHAPKSGPQARKGKPDEGFTFTIAKDGDAPQDVTDFFGISDPKLETWQFSYYEDLFAQDADEQTVVNVASKAYRHLALYEPGHYTATLSYYNGEKTEARWYVRDLADVRKTKNVLLFIGDGMTTNMITAARLIGHRMVNGRYNSRLTLDKFPILGHQMTHSLDSFITDSANSATALYTGHKSTVNALGVYRDSSPDAFDDPKVETLAEIFHRVYGGHIGIVTTAFIADATPAAMSTHTVDRDLYEPIIDQFLRGFTNYSWTGWKGPDVLFGGGAENFFTGELGSTYHNRDYYKQFSKKGYQVVTNLTSLKAASNDRTLGIFCQSNFPVWLDRNVYTDNLADFENDPLGSTKPELDLPGLKDMTLKAIDILEETSGSDGWFLMSEAASIDKQMHTLDYDRALGDLLELDDTVKAVVKKLRQSGTLEDTLILVTADHGHGFDVAGNVDTKYLAAQKSDRRKRNAVGTYANSGLSQYTIRDDSSPVNEIFFTNGTHFPANWNPRYTLFSGFNANPDRREDYKVHSAGPREPAVELVEGSEDYYVNPDDSPKGFLVNGTLPTYNDQGVHSLTDVPVYAMGPCQEYFIGSYSAIDIFYGMAECLGLSRYSEEKPYKPRKEKRSIDTKWDDSEDGEWWTESDHWGF